MMKKFFSIPLLLLLAACSKNSGDVLPEENSKMETGINAVSAVTFYEYLGEGMSEGHVNLQTISTSGGNLYVYLDYLVQGEVSRVKANGVAQLDVNNLTIGGAITSYSAGPGDSTWIYDISATVQSLTVQKAYPVGLGYKGHVTGNMSVTKRSRNPWNTASEFLGNYNFSKDFTGTVVPPPPPEGE